ncbi:MAG TPA: C25 family cysteine peptidase [Phycisphaerae bacterium]|nr:C25 family cysteine peptidase [Phycisphaerae bacterium]
MRLFSAIGIALALGMISALPAFAAAPIIVDYSFDQPVMSTVSHGGVSYDRITMRAAPNGGMPGEPALPASGAQILLPMGTEVSEVKVAPGERILLGQYLIEPVGVPVKLTSDAGPGQPPTPNAAIYGSDQPFPQARFVNVTTQGFRGYQILFLKLQPVEYIPASGELYYYPRLRVVVETTDTGRSVSELFRGLPEDAQAVLDRVDNPLTVQSYAGAARRSERSFELLILTTPALAASFEPLKEYHDQNGLPTEIRTTADAGGSDPNSIRNYVTDRYLNDGIDYVLIGADDDLIPAIDLYVDSYSSEIEYAMPGDHYFGCLDGTYNYDGDSYVGEPTDGPGGGDVDLVAEVYVGRASVGNTTEATRFVNKTIWYDSGQHQHPERVLMAGEYLGFGGDSEYASLAMDECVDGSSADGYTTVGIPSSLYSVDRLYDSPSYDWPKSEIMTRIDNGLHIINHLGHGNETYALKMYSSDVSSLTNTDLCFIYTQACLSGHFDGMDCFAEELLVKSDHGVFATVQNARYGWGEYDSADGPSERFNREFWDAVFSPAEVKPQLGRANQDSKEDNVYRIEEPCMRWCYYEATLLGDPTLAVKGVHIPPSLSFPNGVPNRLTPGESTDIMVHISPGTEAYVPGSATVYYSYDGGPFLSTPMVSLGLGLYRATLPPASCGDTPRFYFGAAGDQSGMVYNPSAAPNQTYIATVATLTILLNDDFENDQGWTVENVALLSGAWQRAVPLPCSPPRGEPPTDFDGSGKCFVTQNNSSPASCNTDVDGGPTRLVSPVFDASGLNDPILNYARWWYNDDLDSDPFDVEISNNNGASWRLIERVVNLRGGWVQRNVHIKDYVTLTSQMKLRFSAKDNPNNSVDEGGVDAVYIYNLSCASSLRGDMNCDGSVNVGDIPHFVQALITPADYDADHDGDPFRPCDRMMADMNHDNVVDGGDVQGFVDALILN